MSILLPQQWRRHPPLPQQVDWSSRQAAGLVLCWPLDQRGLLDISNSFLHGTGSPTSTITPYGVGKSFNGSVDVRATPSPPITFSTEWSASAFVRFTSFSNAYNTVLSVGGTTSSYRELHVKSNGKLAVYVFTTGGDCSYDGTGVHTLNTDVWYHLAFSYSNATGLVGYVNGVVDGTAASKGTLITVSGTTTSIAVANNPPNFPTRFVNGSIVDARFYRRALTAAEIRDIYRNPGGLYKPVRGIPVAFDTGGGPQTLTPSLYTNNQTFYSPTVTPGSVTLSPSLYTNQQTFYGPTVTAGAVTLQPPLVTNDQTFYGPTVVAGAVTLQPALYTNTQNFYSPTVTSTVTLQPDLYTNQQSFYSPTIAPGAVTLTPDLYINTQAFYSPTVSQVVAQTIYPDLFVNQNQFFPADVLFAGGGGTVKGGWATERRRLELSIQQRQAQQTLAQSKDKVAKKIAKRIERFVEADFQDEIDEIVALQKEFAKLEARYNNSQQLSTDLRDATKVLQEFIQDEQDAIDLLMLVQEFDARCVIEATASPDVASLMGSA